MKRVPAIHVVWSPVALPPVRLQAARRDLDQATADRIAALARADDRNRATVAHALLRREVAARVGGSPSAVRLRRHCPVCGGDDHGKPEVDAAAVAPVPPWISLAHGGDLAVVALSDAGPVGVDVEPRERDGGWEHVRAHVFSDDEWARTEVDADPDAARLRAWCRKEAAVKLTGHGLALGLERVAIDDGGVASGWRTAVLPDGLGSVRVADLALGPGHHAAVAFGPDGPVPTLAVRAERS